MTENEIEVANKLDELLVEIPPVRNANLLYNSRIAFTDRIEGRCFYAQSYSIYGSQLAMTEILEEITVELNLNGWDLVDDYDGYIDTMDWSRMHTQGDNAIISVEASNVQWNGVITVTDTKREQLIAEAADYQTIFDVRIRYILPQREGC